MQVDLKIALALLVILVASWILRSIWMIKKLRERRQ